MSERTRRRFFEHAIDLAPLLLSLLGVEALLWFFG
jgi:hypothetical protein